MTPSKKRKTASKKPVGASRAAPRPALSFPRACRLLQGIDEKGFCRLCECLRAKQLNLKNRQAFILESDPCNYVGVVVTGAVCLTRTRIDGGRNVLETIPPGGVFGSTYVFRGMPTMGIGVSAVGDTTVLLFETAKLARPCAKVCEVHLLLIRNLLAVMSQTTFAIKQKLRILSQRTIRGRLMLFLHIRAKREKSNEFDIQFDRQALADYLCVDRSALSNELSKLRAEHKVESVKRHFKLLS